MRGAAVSGCAAPGLTYRVTARGTTVPSAPDRPVEPDWAARVAASGEPLRIWWGRGRSQRDPWVYGVDSDGRALVRVRLAARYDVIIPGVGSAVRLGHWVDQAVLEPGPDGRWRVIELNRVAEGGP